MLDDRPARASETPTVEQLETALRNEKRRMNYSNALKSTLYALLVVAAIAVLVSTLVLSVFEITGTSMTPVVSDGDFVLVFKTGALQRGDIIAFNYNNKPLVKRIIAFPGETVNIDSNGLVYINGVPMDEPYITDLAFGDTTIKLPYQVPDGKYFVMGDHRSTSQDSRSTLIGCVSDDQIIGQLLLRFWPLKRFGIPR